MYVCMCITGIKNLTLLVYFRTVCFLKNIVTRIFKKIIKHSMKRITVSKKDNF